VARGLGLPPRDHTGSCGAGNSNTDPCGSILRETIPPADVGQVCAQYNARRAGEHPTFLEERYHAIVLCDAHGNGAWHPEFGAGGPAVPVYRRLRHVWGCALHGLGLYGGADECASEGSTQEQGLPELSSAPL